MIDFSFSSTNLSFYSVLAKKDCDIFFLFFKENIQSMPVTENVTCYTLL